MRGRNAAALCAAMWAGSGVTAGAADAVNPQPILLVSARPNAPKDGFESLSERTRRLVADGLSHLRAGRRDAATEAFDRAVAAMIDAPAAAAADARFTPAFRQLVETLHVVDVQGPSGAPPGWEQMADGAPGAENVEETDAPEEPGDERSAESEDAVTPVGVDFLDQLGAESARTVAPVEMKEASAAAFGEELIDLPIELNEKVHSAISLYSGKFRKWFSAALSRGQPYIPHIRDVFAQHGIPQDLAYLPIVESAFHLTATSRARARGMWQFMPATGRLYGLRQNAFIDERADFQKATVAAAQYLKKLYEMFGDWNLALAGYNAGEGKVQRAIRKTGSADFWELTKGRSFRSETKNYVPLIHAAIIMAKAPETYGIEVIPPGPLRADVVSIRASYPLSVVARCADSTTAVIKALNPQLRRAVTPSSAYELRLPEGAASLASACLATETRVAYRVHTVKKGETAGAIARRYGVTTSSLLAANALSANARLRPSAELLIPETRRTAATPSRPTPAAAPGAGGRHTIRAGDTLYDLAQRYGTSVQALKDLNGLRSSRLSIGRVLVVSAESSN